MKAVLCPVCKGVGRVSAGFYDRGGGCRFWVALGVTPEPCRSCNGKGWVEVRNTDDGLEPIENITYISPPNYNKCPACGGDRDSPTGTGCPMGSHYGSYCEVVK